MSAPESVPRSTLIATGILEVFTNQTDRVFRILLLALVGLVLVFGALKLYCGLSPIVDPWNAFALMNGGWRIVNGQIPHVDFHSPTGPLTHALTAWGMKLAPRSSASLVYGNLLFGVLVAPMAWFVARSRLSAVSTFLFALFIFVLSISCRPLGHGVQNTSYAMVYNRYGYVLLSILMIQLFILSRSSSKWQTVSEGLCSGITLGLLFYCKISYFVVGAGALVACFVICRRSLGRIATTFLGFGAVVALFAGILHISFSAYISDVMLTGLSPSWSHRLMALMDSLGTNASSIYGTFILLSLTSLVSFHAGPRRGATMSLAKLWLIVFFIVASSLFLTSGNRGEDGELPIMLVSGLILLQFLIRSPALTSRASLSQVGLVAIATILVVVPVFFGITFAKDTASIAYSVRWNMITRPSLPASQSFQGDALSAFNVSGGGSSKSAYWRVKDMPARINEGMDLLRTQAASNTRIFCLGHTDPFSLGLGLTPAAGTPLWWDENQLSDPRSLLPAKELFRNVDRVMIPVFDHTDVGCCKETVFRLGEIYGNHLELNYVEIDHSLHWLLLAKREQ